MNIRPIALDDEQLTPLQMLNSYIDKHFYMDKNIAKYEVFRISESFPSTITFKLHNPMIWEIKINDCERNVRLHSESSLIYNFAKFRNLKDAFFEIENIFILSLLEFPVLKELQIAEYENLTVKDILLSTTDDEMLNTVRKELFDLFENYCFDTLTEILGENYFNIEKES